MSGIICRFCLKSGWYKVRVDKLDVDNTGKNTVSIPINESKTVTVPITVLPPKEEMVTKTGSTSDDDYEQNWTIKINPEGKEIDNAWIDEQFDKRLAFKDVEIYTATTKASGEVVPTSHKLVENQDYEIKYGGDIYFINDYAKTNDTFVIDYNTVLANKDQEMNNVGVTNKAMLNYDGDDNGNPPSGSNTIQINYKPKQMLSKSLVTTTNAKQDYQWKIEYNPKSVDVKAGTEISDTVGQDQVLLPEGVTDGGIIVSPGIFYSQNVLSADGSKKPLVAGQDYSVTYTDDNTKMVIKLNKEINTPLVITYYTHVTTDIPKDGTTISNTVNDNQGNKPLTSTGKVTPYKVDTFLGKGLDYYDADTRVASWHIDVNPGSSRDGSNPMNLKDYWIQDQLPDNLTLDPSSVVVTDWNGKTVDSSKYNFEQNAEGFKITFGDIDSSYKVTYKTTTAAGVTKVDDNAVVDGPDPYDGRGQAGIPIPHGQDQKVGAQNRATGNFDWAITANTDESVIEDGATITDTITANQNYVPGSVRVYKIKPNAQGEYAASKSNVNDSYSFSDNTANVDITQDLIADKLIEEPSGENGNKLTIHLPKGSRDAFGVTLSTSAKDPFTNIEYFNTANFNNGGTPEELPGDAGYSDRTGKMIEKTGQVEGKNAAKVKWQVTVNESSMHLVNTVVTDTASYNQVVDPSSIVISQAYRSKYDARTLLAKPDDAKDDFQPHTLKLGTEYTVDSIVEPDGRTVTTIHFNVELDEPYFINYESAPSSSEATGKVTNEVNIKAKDVPETLPDKTASVGVNFSGGSGTGYDGQAKIIKSGSDGGTLPGAEFTFENEETGKTYQGTTDKDGVLFFSGLKNGKYILTEIKAPAGYKINSDLAKGEEFDVENTQEKPVTEIPVMDDKIQGKIVLTKEDSVGHEALPGAHFDLYRLSGDDKTKVNDSDLITGEDGKITVSDLETGNYEFVETKAPNGYVIDGDGVTKVTVGTDATADKPIELTVTNPPETILPHTGGSGTWQWLALGLTALALGFTAWHFRKNWEVM